MIKVRAKFGNDPRLAAPGNRRHLIDISMFVLLRFGEWIFRIKAKNYKNILIILKKNISFTSEYWNISSLFLFTFP